MVMTSEQARAAQAKGVEARRRRKEEEEARWREEHPDGRESLEEAALWVSLNPKGSERSELEKLMREEREGRPGDFLDRLERIGKVEAQTRVEVERLRLEAEGKKQEWDGKGPCPTCGHEKLPPDEGAARARALLDRLQKEFGS